MKRYPEAVEPDLRRRDTRARVKKALRFARRLAVEEEVPAKTLDNWFGDDQRGPGRWLRWHLLHIKRDKWNGVGGACRLLVLRREGLRHVERRLKESEAQHTEPGKRLVLEYIHSSTSSSGPALSQDERLYSNIASEHWRGLLDVQGRLYSNTSLSGRAGALAAAVELLVDEGYVSRRHKVQVEQELTELSFTYFERGGRLNHPLQWVEGRLARDLWAVAGLPFDYDISTAQPTLLYQQALRWGASPYLLGPVADFLADKATYREVAADLLGVSSQVAKQVVTSLFICSTISASHRCKLYAAHGAKAIEFREHALIKPLIRSIQRGLWPHLRLEKAGGRTGSLKAAYARRLERRVLDAVHRYLTRHGVKHFLIHDGWRTDRELDVKKVRRVVRWLTGFNIEVEVK